MRLKNYLSLKIGILLTIGVMAASCVPEPEKQGTCATGESYDKTLRRCIASTTTDEEGSEVTTYDTRPIIGTDQTFTFAEGLTSAQVVTLNSAYTKKEDAVLEYHIVDYSPNLVLSPNYVSTTSQAHLSNCFYTGYTTNRNCYLVVPADADFTGEFYFTYRAFDGEEYSKDTATVKIIIAETDDDPTISFVGATVTSSNGMANPPQYNITTSTITSYEDQIVTLSGITLTEGGNGYEKTQELSARIISDTPSIIPSSSILLSYKNSPLLYYPSGYPLGDGTDAGDANNATFEFQFTPIADSFGTALLRLQVSDDNWVTYVERTITVVVHDINDAPTINLKGVPSEITVNEDGYTEFTFYIDEDFSCTPSMNCGAGSDELCAQSIQGSADPTGNVAAPIGAIYLSDNESPNRCFRKTGALNSNWVEDHSRNNFEDNQSMSITVWTDNLNAVTELPPSSIEIYYNNVLIGNGTNLAADPTTLLGISDGGTDANSKAIKVKITPPANYFTKTDAAVLSLGIMVEDSGGTLFGGSNSTSDTTRTIRVKPVNDAPTITSFGAGNVTSTENGTGDPGAIALGTLTLESGGSYLEDDQAITIKVTVENTTASLGAPNLHPTSFELVPDPETQIGVTANSNVLSAVVDSGSCTHTASQSSCNYLITPAAGIWDTTYTNLNDDDMSVNISLDFAQYDFGHFIITAEIINDISPTPDAGAVDYSCTSGSGCPSASLNLTVSPVNQTPGVENNQLVLGDDATTIGLTGSTITWSDNHKNPLEDPKGRIKIALEERAGAPTALDEQCQEVGIRLVSDISTSAFISTIKFYDAPTGGNELGSSFTTSIGGTDQTFFKTPGADCTLSSENPIYIEIVLKDNANAGGVPESLQFQIADNGTIDGANPNYIGLDFSVNVTSYNEAAQFYNFPTDDVVTNELTETSIEFKVDEGGVLTGGNGDPAEDSQSLCLYVENTGDTNLVPNDSSHIWVYWVDETTGARTKVTTTCTPFGVSGTGQGIQLAGNTDAYSNRTYELFFQPVASRVGSTSIQLDLYDDDGAGNWGAPILGSTNTITLTVQEISAMHNGWLAIKAFGADRAYIDTDGNTENDFLTDSAVRTDDTAYAKPMITLAWPEMKLFEYSGSAWVDKTPTGYAVYRSRNINGPWTLIAKTDDATLDIELKTITGGYQIVDRLSDLDTVDVATPGATTANNGLTSAKVYFYKVRPISTGSYSMEARETDTGSSYSIVHVIAPSDNRVFVHRRMANKRICEEMGAASADIDKDNFNRCPYVGPGEAFYPSDGGIGSGYYDIGRDLLVDRYEMGCPYTIGTSACPEFANGCIGYKACIPSYSCTDTERGICDSDAAAVAAGGAVGDPFDPSTSGYDGSVGSIFLDNSDAANPKCYKKTGYNDTDWVELVGYKTVTSASFQDVFYSRDSGKCYLSAFANSSTDWHEVSSQGSPLLAGSFAQIDENRMNSRFLPPRTHIAQTDANSTCAAVGNVTLFTDETTSTTLSTKRLPTRKEQIVFSDWESDTNAANKEAGTLVSSSSCNTKGGFQNADDDGPESTAVNIYFTDTDYPSSMNEETLPGSHSSGIRSLRTGSKSTRASCQSFFGVQDAVGNVAEWASDRFWAGYTDPTATLAYEDILYPITDITEEVIDVSTAQTLTWWYEAGGVANWDPSNRLNTTGTEDDFIFGNRLLYAFGAQQVDDFKIKSTAATDTYWKFYSDAGPSFTSADITATTLYHSPTVDTSSWFMPMGLPKSGTDDLFSHWDATLATPAWVALTNLVTVTPTATGNIRGDKIRIFHAQMQKSGSWNGANGAGAKFLSHAGITAKPFRANRYPPPEDSDTTIEATWNNILTQSNNKKMVGAIVYGGSYYRPDGSTGMFGQFSMDIMPIDEVLCIDNNVSTPAAAANQNGVCNAGEHLFVNDYAVNSETGFRCVVPVDYQPEWTD